MPDAFVIQKHAATALHYDLRLELDGVLLSWAVPKGPSLSTKDKRLAVRVDDHGLEHLVFEGTYPRGERGPSPVIVWDRGTWEPVGDPREGLAKGRLTFVLHGEKVRGRFRLVRLPSNWLLMKGKDEFARTGPDADIVEREPRSVLTGRTMPNEEEVLAEATRELPRPARRD